MPSLKVILPLLFLILLHSNPTSCHGIIRDSEVETIIKKLSSPIFSSAGIDSSLVRVFIVNDKNLNAYIIDNSNIFINLGLMQFSYDPHVILGVIAHEIGHISGNHIIQRTKSLRDLAHNTGIGYLLGIIAAVTINSEVGQALIFSSDNIGKRMFLKYTRTQEEAADLYALHYLDNSYYSNKGLIKLLQYLSKNEFKENDQYLLTHPTSYSRLIKIQSYLRKNEVKDIPSNDIKLFKRAVTKLNAFLSPISLVKYKNNDDTTLSRYSQAIVYYRKSQISKSLEILDSLIKEFPKDPYFHELKAQVLYETGQIEKSIESYKLALSFSPNDLLIKLELSQALLLNDQKSAIFYLEQVVSQEEYNSFAWKQLAVAYGKSGNLGMSYFSLAKKAFIEGNSGRFNQYAELAEKHLKNNKFRLIEIHNMAKHISNLQK